VSFSCSRRAGAILSLPLPARRQDTLARGDFGKWIVKHIDLWFAFTRRLGLGITRMEEIVLVTGCHLARSWANIAFLGSREEEQVSFGVRVSGGSDVEWRFPPEEVQGVASNLGPSGQVSFNENFLIHSYRVCPLTNDRIRIYPRTNVYLSGAFVSPDFGGYFRGFGERQGQYRVQMKMNLAPRRNS
jgi:hypothetical protein